MGLLDTWREVRQQIIDSKPTYEPFITPTEYVSPFYTDTPEPTVEAALAPSAPVYDQGLLYKRPLNLPTDSDEPQQPTTYNPVETTTQLQKLMEQTPTVNALSAILPGGILMNAAQRSQVQNAANRIFGPALQGGPFGFGDMIPFFGGDYEARIRNTIDQYSPEAITARWANYPQVVEQLQPPVGPPPLPAQPPPLPEAPNPVGTWSDDYSTPTLPSGETFDWGGDDDSGYWY